MGETHPPLAEIKKLFQEWHVKGAVLMSLFLQMLLLFLATFRKRTSNPFVQFLVYGVYQLSSIVANAAFALIVGTHLFSTAQMPFGLWAALMLLHMAGQERMTAYSLEDNNTWLTSFLGLVWQYFFHYLICMSRGDLPLPTAIICSVAFIRLLARTLRLRFGMLDMSGFTQLPDPYPLILNDDVQLNEKAESTTDVVMQTVLKAHSLLRSSLRLIAGIKHGRGRHDRDFYQRVRQSFLGLRDPRHAIRIVEAELNLIYDSFYTDGTIRKHLNDHYSSLYAALCSFSSLCCVITLIAFLSSSEKGNYSEIDYSVTCILLWGTVILELLAYLLTVFSDWTISSLGEGNGGHLLLAFVPHRRRWWSDNDVVSSLVWMHSVARVLFRRWSETISKFNFLAYSIRQPKETQASYIRPEVLTGITGLVRSFKFVASDWYTDELGVFIFEELKAKNVDVISSLNQKWWDHDNFKKSVLSWHIATELLYNFEGNCEQHQSQDREYSKLLSDYMAYLFFMKPQLIYRLRGNPLVDIERARESIQAIALGQDLKGSLQKFCQNFKECFQTSSFPASTEGRCHWWTVAPAVREVTYKVDGTPDLRVKWSELSKKWVELLLYAATESDSLEHVRGLCQGGELLSIVWLLAFHCGFL